MFDFLKKILTPDEASKNQNNSRKKLEVATCALFIEIAKADSSFDDVEREKIIKIMKRTFELDQEYVEELIEMASESVQKSISLYDFTPLINDNFNPAEKFELLKNLWRLVFIDNQLDKYEEHLVKRIGKMLNLDYPDIIAARLLVKEEIKD